MLAHGVRFFNNDQKRNGQTSKLFYFSASIRNLDSPEIGGSSTEVLPNFHGSAEHIPPSPAAAAAAVSMFSGAMPVSPLQVCSCCSGRIVF
jgi:hypothetical protein